MQTPSAIEVFVARSLPTLQADPRLLGVAAAGSWITRSLDEWSDLDLVLVVDPNHYEALQPQRPEIAASLGDLLSCFTGEHVGEPRLLICLYDNPLLHVDLKFITPSALAQRVENPVILWERDSALSIAMQGSEPCWPMPELTWFEDRFWIWLHYAAVKLGRGELFECVGTLSFLREMVLGPLMARLAGRDARGVRKIETWGDHYLPELRATVATLDPVACLRALQACSRLYTELADRNGILPRTQARHAVSRFLAQLVDRVEPLA